MSQAQPTPAPSTNGTTNATTSTSSLSIAQSAPVGIITITQPPQTATSFYKIAPSQLITFAWNFSMVIATPTHLTVSAVCDNGNTYPVGPTDGIIPGTASSVVWDVNSYQVNHPNTPLAQASYTLHIWDDRGPNAGRAPGYLQANTGLKFALYTPQPYTPLSSGWQCNTCGSNSAYAAIAANPAFAGIVTAILVMFLSGFSLLRLGPRMR